MRKPKGLRDLPDPKEKDLIPPDMDYVYFDGMESFTFRPATSGYSPENAWWLAECSFLAYCHPGFARMAYQLAGFSGFRFFQGKGTECKVSWNKSAAIVSFRGRAMALSTQVEDFHIPGPDGTLS